MEITTVSLANYSSLHVGGEAKMVVIRSESELVEAVRYTKSEGLRVHIVGEGTNTFFGEHLENLVVIKNEITRNTTEYIKKSGEKIGDTDFVVMTFGAGEIWDTIVQFTVDNNLWGIENLSYIPGTVGAAPVQNIGAYGVELKDVLVDVRVYDLEEERFLEFKNKDCCFGYRDSLFKKHQGKYCIVSVTLQLSKKSNPQLSYKPLDSLLEEGESITPAMVREKVIAVRKAKLPDYREYPNTGSFFKNPVIEADEIERVRAQYPDIPLIATLGGYKIPAAWLIEHVAQMKGVRVGDVGTWPTQPLVIVNYGSVSGSEILAFSDTIIQKIKESVDIELEREVNYVV
jgi:UDP-N-acetylmuramate dehydrogenase